MGSRIDHMKQEIEGSSQMYGFVSGIFDLDAAVCDSDMDWQRQMSRSQCRRFRWI